jgi:transposase
MDKRYPTTFDQINQLTALRAELEWLADVPRNGCGQVLVELEARARVARLQRKAARQRAQVLHTESHRYAKSHGVAIMEKLAVRAMSKSARGTVEEPRTNVAQKAGLNRAILDRGWGAFVGMLRYKVVPEGGRVLEVPAAYGSQTCSVCGGVSADSRQAQDVFLCVTCGHFANADRNAAQGLLARGMHALAVEATGTGCGGTVARGRPKKQQLRVVRRGTHASEERKAPRFSEG